jgi:hypothetical protein
MNKKIALVFLLCLPAYNCLSQTTLGVSLSNNSILGKGISDNKFLFPALGGNVKITYEGENDRNPHLFSWIIYEFGFNALTNQEMNSTIHGFVWTWYYTEFEFKLVPVQDRPKWNIYLLTGFGAHMMTLSLTDGHDYYSSVTLGLGTYYKFHNQHKIELYIRPKYIWGMQFGQHFGLETGLNLALCAGCRK